MYSWGLVLMVVGGLSFVLPIFGRQFIIVAALGLTGMGSAVAGIVLFAVGLMLFNTAKRNEIAERARQFADFGVKKPAVAPAPLAVSDNTKPANESASPQGGGRTPHFTLPNGESIDPHSFGVFAVKTAIEDSQQAVEAMIGTGESPGQQSIRSKKGAVQLHLVALIAGVLYVCAYVLTASDKQVLTAVASGLSDGFTALFSDESGKLSNPNNPRSLYGLFEDYSGSLADELNSIDAETLGTDSMDLGATARLVVENISGQCEMRGILSGSLLERVMLERVASTYGASLLLRLLLAKQIGFSR